jgi:hypothetical protein
VIGHADRLEYQPALDGIRALAVALVLVFHADLGVVGGGYVGVSVFFTLSGYLITRLLLVEITRTGTVDVPGFFARRLRRLLPASLACLAAVIVAARLGAFAEDLDLRRDVIGAAFQVQNWVQLAGGDSYRELLQGGIERASPVEHSWSLAIEEQLYWLWPLAVTGLALARKRHRVWALTPGSPWRLRPGSPPSGSPCRTWVTVCEEPEGSAGGGPGYRSDVVAEREQASREPVAASDTPGVRRVSSGPVRSDPSDPAGAARGEPRRAAGARSSSQHVGELR